MYYATEQDRQHAIRKLAYHRLVARCLRGPKGRVLHGLAIDALDRMARDYPNAPYVAAWKDMLSHNRHEIARRLVERDEHVELLRETSPFMNVFGFDMGARMPIVFRDEALRSRMWKLAKRVASIERSEEPIPVAGRQPKF